MDVEVEGEGESQSVHLVLEVVQGLFFLQTCVGAGGYTDTSSLRSRPRLTTSDRTVPSRGSLVPGVLNTLRRKLNTFPATHEPR